MAEGWCRHLHADRIEAFSAGIERHGLNPWAVQVMAEAGVDIANQQSKLIEELSVKDFYLVVTVCDHAAANCPIFPGNVKVLHQSFDDPPALARSLVDAEAKLNVYRRVRDEIRRFVVLLLELIS